MATSNVLISNLALGHCGVGAVIQSLTESSESARACNLYFEYARDEVLRDFPWPFATKREAMTLAEEFESGESEWAYSYRLPSDCLMPRRIWSAMRQAVETTATQIPYGVGRDATGPLIFTDQVDAELEYTFLEDDPTRYAADFVSALAYRLAAYIAPRLAKNNNMKGEMEQFYAMAITKARGNASKEERPDPRPDSDIINVRNG